MSNPTVQITPLDNLVWMPANQCSYSVTATTHVWCIRISPHVANINELWNLLTADEQERAGRYYREKDKERFIVSRGALRILLGKYLNTDAKDIAFEIGNNKKPHVKGNAAIHYNVSHSGDYVLIAISAGEVGVDVEKPDHDIHYDEIMQISYSKPEIDYVNESHNTIQAFYTLWTRKESLIKATAKGIDDGLKFIPSIDGLHTTLFNTIGSEKNWIINSFAVDPEHLGSVASTYKNITFWDFGH